MAKFSFPVFPMTEDIVSIEDIQAGMLEDLEKLTGISFPELMASEFEEPQEQEQEPVFRTGEIDDVSIEDTIEDDFDMDNDTGDDFDDYLRDEFEDMDIDTDENDAYSETDV